MRARGWRPVSMQELTHQQLVGTAVLTSMLPKADHRTWVADADLTPATLRHLRDSGVRTARGPRTQPRSTRHSKVSRESDRALQGRYRHGFPDPRSPDRQPSAVGVLPHADPGLGANQLLAELALISFEQNGAPGGVVLAPPDNWQAVTDVPQGAARWSRSGQPGRRAHDGGSPLRPGPAGGIERVGGSAQRRVPRVRSRANAGPSGATVLGRLPSHDDASPDALGQLHVDGRTEQQRAGAIRPSPARRRFRRPVSSSSRTPPSRPPTRPWTRQFNSIVAPLTEKVTLTSRNADFPLTLQSRLGYPVDVVIDLQASNRLTFPGGNRIQKRLEGQRTRVKLRVRAPVSGDTPVQVTVRSPDGNVVLATSRYTVRVTAVSGVGVVLTSGAALFLVIWWVRHWRSSARLRNGSAGLLSQTPSSGREPLRPGGALPLHRHETWRHPWPRPTSSPTVHATLPPTRRATWT